MTRARHVFMTVVVLGSALAVAFVGLGVGSGSSRAADGKVDVRNLPIGDGKVSTTGARRGWIYACQVMQGGGGSFRDGEWIHDDGTFDLTAKPTVDGSVEWPDARVRISRSGGRTRISGNGLPVNATTGVFPIAAGDDAYQYDRNPNSIRSQTVSLTLPKARRASKPSCVNGGTVGYATNGVAIFNGLDAMNRDAVAHEIQDDCGGHPERSGAYHYHSGSGCVTGSSRKAKVVGWMLDGYPLVNEPGITNDDLDACHGRTSTISISGKRVRTYHYNVTAEYPYTIGCFRGTPLRSR
jgi:hypothetical protein